MAKAGWTAKRTGRRKAVDWEAVAVLSLPAIDGEHLDVSALETWLWEAALQ